MIAELVLPKTDKMFNVGSENQRFQKIVATNLDFL